MIISSCSDSSSQDDKHIAERHIANIIEIQPVNYYDIQRQYVGAITSPQISRLSFEFGGKINSLLVDVGDIIIKGQTLAKLDTTLLALNTNEINAQITQTNAQFELNKTNLLRLNTLDNNGYTSKQNIDELNTEKQILIATKKRLESLLAVNQYQLSQATISAPFNGYVSQRLHNMNENINPGDNIYELIQKDTLHINIGVASHSARKLSVNDELTLDINHKTINAKIVAISQQIDPINRTVNIRLSYQESMTVFNDDIVKATINERIEKTGFWVPLSALTDGIRGQWNIMIAQEIAYSKTDSYYKLQKHTVNVLYTNKTHAYITGLIIKNHSIIASGLQRLVPEQEVIKSKNISSKHIAPHNTALTHPDVQEH